MIQLTKPQILLLHEQLIAETGGSSGLSDEGMLDSALNSPSSPFPEKTSPHYSSRRRSVFALVW